MRTLQRLAASTLTAACLALPISARADEQTGRRAGDVLSFALPAATLGVELWRGDRAGSLQFAESLAVTLAATEVLKRSTGVERPDRSNDNSFPSGHAARAFAAATYVHRRHGIESAWPLYAAALYVGHTRVQAERHRWGDVAGAAFVAAASSWWIVEPIGPAPRLTLMPRGMLFTIALPLP